MVERISLVRPPSGGYGYSYTDVSIECLPFVLTFIITVISTPAPLYFYFSGQATLEHLLHWLAIAYGISAFFFPFCIPTLRRIHARHKALPREIQAHWESEISPSEYRQLREVSEQYPEIRPWIEAVLVDDKITYRAAQPLVRKINTFLRQQPKRQFLESVKREPHAATNDGKW